MTRNRLVPLASGAVALLCLAAALVVAAWWPGMRGNPLPWLLGLLAQRQAQSEACSPPWQVVAGSYQAEPVQVAGDWVVVVYQAECAAPGQPTHQSGGYVAWSGQGPRCTAAGFFAMENAAPAGAAAFDGVWAGPCPGPQGPGGPGGLNIVTGRVSDERAIQVEVLLANGQVLWAPVRERRFAILAPGEETLCLARVLDASGQVLGSERWVYGGSSAPQSGCP